VIIESSRKTEAGGVFDICTGVERISVIVLKYIANHNWVFKEGARLRLLLDIPHGFALHYLDFESNKIFKTSQRYFTIAISASKCIEYILDLQDFGNTTVIDLQSIDELPSIMSKVSQEELFIDNDEATPLSLAERRVLRCIAAGMSQKEIAQRLSFGHQYVKNTVASIYEKLDLRNLADAILYYWSVRNSYF